MTPTQSKLFKAALLVSVLMIIVGFALLASTENMLYRAGKADRDAAVIRKEQFEIAGPVLMAAGALGLGGVLFAGSRAMGDKK